MQFLLLQQISSWSENTSTASQTCGQTPTGDVSMCPPQQEPAYTNLQLTPAEHHVTRRRQGLMQCAALCSMQHAALCRCHAPVNA